MASPDEIFGNKNSSHAGPSTRRPRPDDILSENPGRVFEEVNVGNFHAQPAKSRIGEAEEIPQYSTWRLNLTALSQRFNLYFVAQRDEIHLRIPRNQVQMIPIESDLILKPPRSEAGKRVHGVFPRETSHCINHIKIGDLGNIEILLMCCDDGDVIAYFTHLLDRQTRVYEKSSVAPVSDLKPFFHENVGYSAWGLSIHKDDRMIAVSSNERAVSVFYFALHFYTVIRGTGGFMHIELDSLSKESWLEMLLSRAVDMKLILRLGAGGGNIPSVDFCNDNQGSARAILAADINGNLWILDLRNGMAIREPGIDHYLGPSPSLLQIDLGVQYPRMGWGVIYIPRTFLKAVETPHEALGHHGLKPILKPLNSNFHTTSDARSEILDISCTKSLVQAANFLHPSHPDSAQQLKEILERRRRSSSYFLQGSDSDSESDECKKLRTAESTMQLFHRYSFLGRHIFTGMSSSTWCEHLAELATMLKEDPDSPSVAQWIALTSKRLKRFNRCVDANTEVECFNRAVFPDKNKSCHLTPSCGHISPDAISPKLRFPDTTGAVLRTWDHDVQLLPSSTQLMSTVCKELVVQKYGLAGIDVSYHPSRLNMHFVIPELSLVLLATQLGRVAIVTLVELRTKGHQSLPTFRIDSFLPLAEHDALYRPSANLVGLAVSPTHSQTSNPSCNLALNKFWRVFLHYADDTILSYDLSRNWDSDLSAF